MSRNHPARRSTRTTLLLAATMMAGCERGTRLGARDAATRDTVAHAAPGAPGAPAPGWLPTPGFSSAQGTPPPVPAPAIASAAVAARLAPPPSAALAAQITADEQNAIRMLPAGAGHDLVVGDCLICHSAVMLEQQHKDTAQWDRTVTQMMAWGAPVTATQKPMLLAYLADHFGAGAAASPSP